MARLRSENKDPRLWETTEPRVEAEVEHNQEEAEQIPAEEGQNKAEEERTAAEDIAHSPWPCPGKKIK